MDYPRGGFLELKRKSCSFSTVLITVTVGYAKNPQPFHPSNYDRVRGVTSWDISRLDGIDQVKLSSISCSTPSLPCVRAIVWHPSPIPLKYLLNLDLKYMPSQLLWLACIYRNIVWFFQKKYDLPFGIFCVMVESDIQLTCKMVLVLIVAFIWLPVFMINSKKVQKNMACDSVNIFKFYEINYEIECLSCREVLSWWFHQIPFPRLADLRREKN